MITLSVHNAYLPRGGSFVYLNLFFLRDFSTDWKGSARMLFCNGLFLIPVQCHDKTSYIRINLLPSSSLTSRYIYLKCEWIFYMMGYDNTSLFLYIHVVPSLML